ncbi:hypothetical protein E2C01_040132 [Portunus trituberculatus]|uniref:Uncharacterized protein n=1 Tax=Portunus trituberculatus TaxID=210409 RepID=A0A5B7FIV3_PORTR|nr:hypothetical protein [Portunus trituberculatus]
MLKTYAAKLGRGREQGIYREEVLVWVKVWRTATVLPSVGSDDLNATSPFLRHNKDAHPVGGGTDECGHNYVSI